jgi:hypothetical protein
MKSYECDSLRARPTGGTSAARLPVDGVNAHLRLIPSDPGEFRVVVTFHDADGLLCEAELKPIEAAGLMSEIVRVIDKGNNAASQLTSCEKQEAQGA